jgi:hypothetical protein
MAADYVLIEVRSRLGIIAVPMILVGTGVSVVAFMLLVRKRYSN